MPVRAKCYVRARHRLRAIVVAAIGSRSAIGAVGAQGPRVPSCARGGARGRICGRHLGTGSPTRLRRCGEPRWCRGPAPRSARCFRRRSRCRGAGRGTAPAPAMKPCMAWRVSAPSRLRHRGVSPGETAAFGMANSRPVLLIRAAYDAAVAVWVLIGRAMLARLWAAPGRRCAQDTLTGKVASTVALTELVLVASGADASTAGPRNTCRWRTACSRRGWIVIPAAERRTGVRCARHGEAAAMRLKNSWAYCHDGGPRRAVHQHTDLLAAVALRTPGAVPRGHRTHEARRRFEGAIDLSPLAPRWSGSRQALGRGSRGISAPRPDVPCVRPLRRRPASRARRGHTGAGDRTPRGLKLNAEVIACGHPPALEVRPGTASTIATAAHPRGADADGD